MNKYIKEFDIFIETFDYIEKIRQGNCVLQLITRQNKVLLFTHCDRDGNIKEKNMVKLLIHKYKFMAYKDSDIELICCFPNLAKKDKELGKYVKIDSNKEITVEFSGINNSVQKITLFTEKEDFIK